MPRARLDHGDTGEGAAAARANKRGRRSLAWQGSSTPRTNPPEPQLAQIRQASQALRDVALQAVRREIQRPQRSHVAQERGYLAGKLVLPQPQLGQEVQLAEFLRDRSVQLGRDVQRRFGWALRRASGATQTDKQTGRHVQAARVSSGPPIEYSARIDIRGAGNQRVFRPAQGGVDG